MVASSEKVSFAVGRLLDRPNGWRSVVRDMVERWPEAQATELVFVLVSAATEIEAKFGRTSPEREAAELGWRLAGLLGVDLYAMESVGLPRARAADLTGYWLIDPFFRDL